MTFRLYQAAVVRHLVSIYGLIEARAIDYTTGCEARLRAMHEAAVDYTEAADYIATAARLEAVHVS